MVLILISWLLKKGHSDLGFVRTSLSMENWGFPVSNSCMLLILCLYNFLQNHLCIVGSSHGRVLPNVKCNWLFLVEKKIVNSLYFSLKTWHKTTFLTPFGPVHKLLLHLLGMPLNVNQVSSPVTAAHKHFWPLGFNSCSYPRERETN